MKRTCILVTVLLFASVSLAADRDFSIENKVDPTKKARIIVEKSGSSGVLARVTLGKGESKKYDFSSQSGGVRVSVYDDATSEKIIDRQTANTDDKLEITGSGKNWKLSKKK